MDERRHQTDYDYYDRRPSDLQRLKTLDDWNIVEGEPDVRGWSVEDQRGEKVGRIEDLLVSTEAQEAIFAMISYGDVLGVGGKHALIPLDRLDVDADHKRAAYDGSVDDVKNAPEYRSDTHDYGPFYDYWSGHRAEGRAERPERIGEQGRKVIPEVEEHMEVSKHEEQVGEVEVSKKVETLPETVKEPVRHTRVHVFRRQVEPREAQPGEQTVREGETVRIPVVEEKLVTEKRAEVTGEVVVQPETVEEEEEVSTELRKEYVEMKEHGDVMEEEEEEEEERTRRI